MLFFEIYKSFHFQMGQNGSAPIPPEALAQMGQQNNIQNFQLKAVKKEPIESNPVGASVHQV